MWLIVIEILVTIIVTAVVAIIVVSRIEASIWLLHRRLRLVGDVAVVRLVNDLVYLVSYTLSRKSTVSILEASAWPVRVVRVSSEPGVITSLRILLIRRLIYKT